MKKLLLALASVAVLAAPMASSAQDFRGHGGGGRAPQGAAPAFHGGFARGGGQRGGFPQGGGFRGGFAQGGGAQRGGFAHAYNRGGYERGGGYGRGDYGDRRFGRGYGWAVGGILPALYWDAYLSDPVDYGLSAAPYGYHWVDVGDQALLIDNDTGVVVQVVDL